MGNVAMMRAEIGDIPADGTIAARQHLGDVEIGNEVKFHTAPGFGLVIAKQAGAVQRRFDPRQHTRLALGGRGVFAQQRKKRFGAAHGLVIRHIGETGG